MYIVNHGIAQHAIDAVHAAADAFYALPDSVKQRCDINRLDGHRATWPSAGR
jgi:isopenicillin N synthase-like dioxygenase